jgi:hypothetical protein
MALNWEEILRRFATYPPGVQELRPPCSEEKLREVQSRLGELPSGVIDMLRHFDGANLFCTIAASITIFPASGVPPLPRFEWAEGWYIDEFTLRWRAAKGDDRENDWAIAMTNYGGVTIVRPDGRVREWDTAQRAWDPRTFDNFDLWFEMLLREGDEFLKQAVDDVEFDKSVEGDAYVPKVYLPRP